eukprot:scaffold1459_cov90-Alexandrium_tamarense.AAC.1
MEEVPMLDYEEPLLPSIEEIFASTKLPSLADLDIDTSVLSATKTSSDADEPLVGGGEIINNEDVMEEEENSGLYNQSNVTDYFSKQQKFLDENPQDFNATTSTVLHRGVGGSGT